MTTEVRLEDIQVALSHWARQDTAQKDRIRLLDARVEELTLLIKHAIEQGQDSFNLPRNSASTMQLVIEEAVLSVQARGAEQVRTIAGQKDQIDNLTARLSGLETEIRESVDQMTSELELPANRHRTLRNAVNDVCGMILEAKKIIQENL